MANLLATLAIATGALGAEQGALTETANNVANLNTPGYSRQVPTFVENPPTVVGSLTFGTGVRLDNVQTIRDPILQLRIQQQTGEQGRLDTLVSGLQQIESQFSSQDSDIGSQLSALFASISQLSTNPTSIALRQDVLTSAANLASTFRNTANNLLAQQKNIDLNVIEDVQQINTLTQQIAQLNSQIAALQNVGQNADAFIDQRDLLISRLSQLMDVSQIKTESSVTLTTSSGTVLVAGNQNFPLATQVDSSGQQRVLAAGNDITGQISSGKLGGDVALRDQKIPALLSRLDTLAAALETAFNGANASGLDLNGNAGTTIFAAPPVGGQGAAVAMTVTMTDPALLAASSDGSAGSNGNLVNFAAVHDQRTVSGATPSEYYANLVFAVGNDVANSTADLTSAQLILQQLQDQRGSISGVSLDEEAAHMVEYQRAYEAAARVVTSVDQMLETVIHMGANG